MKTLKEMNPENKSSFIIELLNGKIEISVNLCTCDIVVIEYINNKTLSILNKKRYHSLYGFLHYDSIENKLNEIINKLNK